MIHEDMDQRLTLDDHRLLGAARAVMLRVQILELAHRGVEFEQWPGAHRTASRSLGAGTVSMTGDDREISDRHHRRGNWVVGTTAAPVTDRRVLPADTGRMIRRPQCRSGCVVHVLDRGNNSGPEREFCALVYRDEHDLLVGNIVGDGLSKQHSNHLACRSASNPSLTQKRPRREVFTSGVVVRHDFTGMPW